MGLVRIVALLVIIPLVVKLVRQPHDEPIRELPPLSSPSGSDLVNNPGASAISKAEDEEWDRHKTAHRLIHDYSESD